MNNIKQLRLDYVEVKFYDTVDDALLKFAVIIARADGKWVLCKHRERNTYEIPGGHREPGEAIDDTAVRELQEETGAREFTIKPVCAYSVTGKNRVNDTGEEMYGMCCILPISPDLIRSCTAKWRRSACLTSFRKH